MYQLGDTITAISSPDSNGRVIIRLSGPRAVSATTELLKPQRQHLQTGITDRQILIDARLKLDAKIYLFRSPHSYTGEDVVEIHFYANRPVADALMEKLFSEGVRQAGPGEFTARSYLGGKIDLSQAEAVNQIISSSNKFQLDSAERLLSGRLSQIMEAIREELLDCLTLLEASLDFSEEQIEIISPRQAAKKLKQAGKNLEDLLAGSISYEIAIELASVGIAGAPNAGKSSLFNKLLGKKRSIVSKVSKTTRDILTGTLTVGQNRCVLFDCAGLINKPQNIIDKLTQQAAIDALGNCDLVVFCVDASKTAAKLDEDIRISLLLKSRPLLFAATKADLLSPLKLSKKLTYLRRFFDADFIITSSKTGLGIEQLKKAIDNKILESIFGSQVRQKHSAALREMTSLTNRHRQSIISASDAINQAVTALKNDSSEAAAMLIRSAVQTIGDIRQPVDEQVLDRIFSTFCIGK
jgi:tRNA modification GTPase